MSSQRASKTSPALDRVRDLCMALPGTSESGDPTDIDLLLKRPRFFATPYGRGQWVGRMSWALVRRLLRRGHELATTTRRE
jgi:hypothetical protein